ncbi:MAG: ATP-binding protein [Myxococcota bacterium]|nr:ATP-binding protein [Myxococcota bacterium]
MVQPSQHSDSIGLGTVGKSLGARLFEAHPSVVDPVQRRIAYLMAMFHFGTIPVSPLSLYLTNYTNPGHVPMDWKWVLVVLTCTSINYALSRSKWYRITLYVQVIAAFCVCYWMAMMLPDRQSVHFLIVLLPSLMAAHLMSYGELKAVAVSSLIGLSTLFFFVSSKSLPNLVGSTFCILVLVMLIVLTRRHYDWVERSRRTTLVEDYARVQSLLEAAYDATVTLVNGRVTQISGRAYPIFLRDDKALIGQRLTEIVSIDSLSTPKYGETTVIRPEGQIGYVTYAVEPLQGEETFVALRDVTEERLETVQQLQLDRMTQTATLAAGIAHEFNTPLMVVMNQIRKAEINVSQTDVETTQILRSAQGGLNQLSDIVRDLKWFIQSSEETVCQSPARVIENTVRLAGHRIGHTSQVIVDHQGESSLRISENQLSQLLLNLLFNANEARKTDNVRSIIRLTTQIRDGVFHLKVSDVGKGMTPAVQARAFQPFFTHGKPTGTGLGLAICNSIVSRVNGSIELTSALGEGTQVSVNLPLSEPQAISSPGASTAFENSGLKLVIDDDELLSALVAEMLDDDAVQSLTSISDAMAILEHSHAALILCDLNMPHGGARRLSQHLRSIGHPSVDQLIIMTGGAVDPAAQSFLDETEVPVLYKPFGHAELSRAINRVRKVDTKDRVDRRRVDRREGF